MPTVLTIDEQILFHDKKIRELQVERAKLNKLQAHERVAEFLHESSCTWNHTDGCGWFYEKSWNDRTHMEYVAKARTLLGILDNNEEKAIKVIRALYGDK